MSSELQTFLDLVKTGTVEVPGGGAIGDTQYTTLVLLDPNDIEAVAAECVGRELVDTSTGWEAVLEQVRAGLASGGGGGLPGSPKEQLRAAYARSLAMQTHLTESQRSAMLDEMVAQALAPTPAPARPVAPDTEAVATEEPARTRRTPATRTVAISSPPKISK